MHAFATTPARSAALLALGLSVGACGSSPELDKQLETLSSWTATMHLAREQHGSGAITTTFATQLRDGARATLDETQRTIGASAHSRVDSAYATAGLDSLRGAMRQLEEETGS